MADVYQRFDKAFASVSAFNINWMGVSVGRVVVKHGARVTAYVHIWGSPMASGYAGGGGYDRVSAAVDAAINAIPDDPPHDRIHAEALAKLRTATLGSEGHSWQRRCEDLSLKIQHLI